MNAISWCVILVLTFVTKARSSGLLPGGTNVVTKYETYYTREATFQKQVRYRRTCTQSCTLWVFCTTRCSNRAYYVMATVYKTVAKTRPKYECKIGWKQSGNECTIPICTGGCQNGGVCTAPEACKCTLAWKGKNCNQDVNECDPSSGIRHGCQATCANLRGSYKCTCPPGHFLASNGKNCTDHDECAPGNIHGCEQGCLNYPGGYNCTCQSGYSLNVTNYKTCDDNDECEGNIHGCEQGCVNYPGGYNCTCGPGYTLNGNDYKTCDDNDECAGNSHGCEQGCINYPGGYNCTCRPGYTLNVNDYKTCDGHQCEEIQAPVDGRMQCTGNTTDHTCKFSCVPGYELRGSSNRSCNASGIWTGDESLCKIIHCPEAPAPRHGFVYSPCDTPFRSECIVGCLRGYFMKGTTKITCDANAVWQPENLSCTKTKACERNPCRHGGVCTPLSSSRYTCDCSNTGYRGINCDIGHITPPKYPRVTTGVPSPPLEFRSSPLTSGHVIITPSSRDVVFTPSFLAFNANSSRQSLAVASVKPGLYFIQYSISGPNASEFTPPGNDVVFVDPVTNSTNHTAGNSSLELPIGCHELELKKCPARGDVVISSTESWVTTGSVTSSNGVIVVRAGKTNFPLSLLGTSLPGTARSPDEKHCEAKRNFSVKQLTNYHVLTKSFLKALKDSFPKWLMVKLRRELNAKSFYFSDVKSQILSGKELRSLPAGKGQPISDDSSFSVLLSPNINVTVENDVLKSRDEKSRISLAVDLCSASPMNVILRVPDTYLNLIQNSSVLKRLKKYGWDFTVSSLQISKTKSIRTLSGKVRFWDGEKLIGSNLEMKGDLALVAKVEKSFAGENACSFLEFDGTFVAAVDNVESILNSPLDQDWSVSLYGNMKLTIQFTVEGRKTNVTLKAAESISFASFGGNPQKPTSERVNHQGLYISHAFETSPFVDSDLDKYVDVSSTDGIRAFLKTKLQSKPASNESTFTPDQIEAVNMAFYGILKFGPLRFEDVGITLRTQQTKTAPKRIRFEGKGQRNTTRKFGIFETNNLNVQIYVPSEDNRESVGSFESSVELLGFKKPVNVSMGKDGLRFNTSGRIHGLFQADLSCVSTLESWQNQKVFASGEFSVDKDGLLGRLREILYDYAYGIYDRAQRRFKYFEQTVQRAMDRQQSIISFLNEKQQELSKSQAEYNSTKINLEAAEMHFKSLGSNVSHRLDRLKRNLHKLCPEVKHCPDICQAGVVCRHCEYEMAGKSKRTCLSTCFKTETQRVEANSSYVPCKRQQCVRVYVKEGLVKNTLQQTLTGLKSDIFSFGRKTSKSRNEKIKDDKSGLFPGTRNEDVCQYPKVSNKVTGSEKICETDDRNGHWDCSVFTESCTASGFRYEKYHAPYACVRPCEAHVKTEIIPKSCCETVPCAFKTVNRTCIAENHFCNKIRIDALDKLIGNYTGSELELLRQVQAARGDFFYWQIRNRKAEIKLASAKRLVNFTQTTADSFLKLYNFSVKSRHNISKVLAEKLNLKWIFDEEMSSINGIEIDSARFNVEVQEGGNYLLPVKLYLKVNGTREELDAIVNFRAVNSSLGSIAKDILDLYSKVGEEAGLAKNKSKASLRKKRSVDDENKTTSYALSSLQKNHRLCSEFTNYERALHDMATSLFNLTSEAKRLLKNSLESNTSDTFNASEIFENFKIDPKEATTFGLEIDKDSYVESLENDKTMSAAHEVQKEALEDGFKPLHLNTKLLFKNWFSAMENIFNVVLPNCTGFEDCVVFITDGLFEMNEASGLPGARKVRALIVDLRSELLRLSHNTDVTFYEANEVSTNILRIIKDMRDVKLFCASAPNITKQPEAFTEIGEGKSLTLTCDATGDSLIYNWKFNDDFLAGRTTNTLFIPNVLSINSGNYTCIVANHISMETSTPALVVVHPAPYITVQPIGRLNAIIHTNNSLRCVAESTDYNMTYEWWFRAKNSSVFIKLAGQEFSHLNFVPVESHHEGWYYCNVSNFYASSRSKTSYVKVLNFTLPFPVATLSVTLAQSQRNATIPKRRKRSEPHPIGYEDIQSKLAKLLSFYKSINQTVNNTSNSSLPFYPQVKNLHVTQCNVVTAAKICKWVFQYVGKNVTRGSGQNFEQSASNVIGSLKELRAVIGRLVRAANDGGLSFDLGDQKFVVERNSVGVEEVATTCSLGRKLKQTFRCVDCPPGYYGGMDENAVATCVPCRVGTYQPNSGETSCAQCSEGFTTVHEGSIDKTRCQVICPAGKYGKITENVGRCLDCPGNTYQPVGGQFDCLPCPDGHVTATKGADDISKCHPEPTTTRRPTERRTTTEQPEKRRTTEREGPATTANGKVAALKNPDDGENRTPVIAGTVGGFLFLCLLVIVLIYLARKRRMARKSSLPMDDKNVIVSEPPLELNSWNVNPGFDEDGNDGGERGQSENPVYISNMISPVTENPVYGTNPGYEDNLGRKGATRDSDDFSDTAILNAHGSYENGDVITNYGNPMYESNPAQDRVNEPGPGESSDQYREPVLPVFKSHDNDHEVVSNFGNPLYDAFEKERALKGASLKLTDDAIPDEDV